MVDLYSLFGFFVLFTYSNIQSWVLNKIQCNIVKSWWYRDQKIFHIITCVNNEAALHAVLIWLKFNVNNYNCSNANVSHLLGPYHLSLPLPNKECNVKTEYGDITIEMLGDTIDIGGICLSMSRKKYIFWKNKDNINIFKYIIKKIYCNCALTPPEIYFNSVKPKVVNKTISYTVPKQIDTMIEKVFTQIYADRGYTYSPCAEVNDSMLPKIKRIIEQMVNNEQTPET